MAGAEFSGRLPWSRNSSVPYGSGPKGHQLVKYGFICPTEPGGVSLYPQEVWGLKLRRVHLLSDLTGSIRAVELVAHTAHLRRVGPPLGPQPWDHSPCLEETIRACMLFLFQGGRVRLLRSVPSQSETTDTHFLARIPGLSGGVCSGVSANNTLPWLDLKQALRDFLPSRLQVGLGFA